MSEYAIQTRDIVVLQDAFKLGPIDLDIIQ